MPQKDTELGTIKIKIEQTLKDQEEVLDRFSKRKSKNPAAASRAVLDARQRISTLRNISQQDSLSAADWNRFAQNAQGLATAMNKLVQNVVGTSKQFQELTETLNKLQSKRELTYQKRDALLASNNARYTKGKGLQFNEKAFWTEYQKGKNAITGQQGTLTNWDYFTSARKSGSTNAWTGLKDYTTAWNAYVAEKTKTVGAEYESLSKEIKTWKKAIQNITNKLNNAPNIDEQLAADTGTTVDNTDFLIGLGNRYTKEVKEAAQNQQDWNGQLDASEFKLKKQESSLGKAFKAFTIYAAVLRTVKTALREAVSTITELDKSLTEQAMVTGHTRQETYNLVKQYQELATQVGATTKEIASVATEYMKQGQTIEDSLVLTQAAVSAAKVARVSVGDSVNYLTTALNGYQMAAEDAMRVSDIFAAVAAASATDYDELAIALSKVASQANLAGMSIEYTTALLTKGLETTREAPETMGTALKTIIARMRELTDYGATLEGDADINTVESQLAYVGIELRNANGELRSTEDVLDELGKKWETLNTNQQAALAKALAGTRQQSRLIALMDGYERVIELQDIADRSAGATAAQASVYLQGIEAAINNVRVAWERVISAFTNSDVITGVINFIASGINAFADALDNAYAYIPVIGLIAASIMKVVGYRLKENEIAQLQLKIQQERLIAELKIQQAVARENALKAKQVQLEQELENTKGKKKKAALQKQIGDLSDPNSSAYKQALSGSQEYTLVTQQLNMALSQQTHLMSLNSLAFSGFAFLIKSIVTPIKTLGVLFVNLFKSIKLGIKGIAAAIKSAGGWIAVIGEIINVALIAWTAISTLVNWIQQIIPSAENSAKAINTLSNEIYTLNERITTIDSAIDTFDELDNKIIKTTEDVEAMNDALASAADKLTEEQQKTYNSLTTNAARRDYLKSISDATREEANKKRQQQLDEWNTAMSRGYGSDMLTSNNSEMISARDALYAINNSRLYDAVDKMTDLTESQRDAIEDLAQSILEAVDAQTALNYANSNYSETLATTLSQLKDIKTSTNEYASANEILTSDDYTLKDRVKAYEQVAQALRDDEKALKAFTDTYSQYEVFAKMGDDVLDFIEKVGLSIDDINDLYAAAEKLRKAGVAITDQDYQSRFDDLLNALADSNGDIATAIETVFGDYLSQFKKGTKDYIDAYNAFINAYADLTAVGMLNMGQNLEALKNQVNNFYEKAASWSSMSEADKTEFIQDNAELFSGASGASLLEAFESGNYAAIQNALMGNKGLNDLVDKRRAEIEQELKIELAKQGDNRNEAYIKYLQDYLTYLEDEENLFAASLETRLEQEQNALDEYKSYLKDQQEALKDSLDKRKEAYQDYFDAINQTEEDEDYEEQAQTLITNISKLGSTTNATASSQRKELVKQLEELEKERLKELRERAQEQVLDNMDTTLDEINDKFDELLNNNRALLAVMTGQYQSNPSAFVNALLANQAANGATDLEMQNSLANLQSIFGGLMSGFDWSSVNLDAITAGSSNNTTNNLMLSLMNNPVSLSSSQQSSLFAAIMKALTEVGLS